MRHASAATSPLGLLRMFLVGILVLSTCVHSFTTTTSLSRPSLGPQIPRSLSLLSRQHMTSPRIDPETAAVEEEARRKVLEARRNQIRGTLRAAESLRNFRRKNGFVPELDENGKPIQADSKVALTWTAFVVAAGAIALRIGGRAALISAIGLDFAKDNPDLKNNMDQILTVANDLNPLAEGALFLLAWTLVKVFLFDAGGIVLALSSGILFGGVVQGAIVSALCATFGSSVAFGMAKLDTPVRKKALEIVEEYPSLRGIEKVVARDGFKAILTLRLAPVLPIPLGMYNYVYGVTNVPLLDFCAGIFLGSLKPYLLDSYLGYFGKSIVDGSAASDVTGIQDIILLVALGLSVLIGVFASQLAGETWESVLEEVEAEKKEKELLQEDKVEDDGIVRQFIGITVPDWLVGFQIALAMADDRIQEFIQMEINAKVWNYTKAEGGVPPELDPARAPNSPEVAGVNTGFDVAASICDGLVLSPALFQTYFKFADPLFDDEAQNNALNEPPRRRVFVTDKTKPTATTTTTSFQDNKEEELLRKLSDLRLRTRDRLEKLDDRLSDD